MRESTISQGCGNEADNTALPVQRSIEREFAASSETPACAARAVLGFALESGFGPACRARIGGAVSEVVDNAIRRGYPTRTGTIRVHAAVAGREIVVTIEDFGIGFDTEAMDDDLLARPLYSGLARASALADGLAIDSEPGLGTRVVLHFEAACAVFDEDGSIDLSDHDYLSPDLARRVLHTLRRQETSTIHQLSPALAVVVGRLLAGPKPRALVERALWR
ncbi:MAG: ATP-binding protein [Planctomycetes bacterium]|nr:ATP-binding protein [Planctomycetota bacterium]